ncbi:hypothetical protein [Natrinema sp. 1APR25-10V2]|uniref:hypothetical protein n=1 Tax=Natrinema sp. 1APR25-10V2 TaxID=2951081 RepID=UPI0028769B5C|nr:hypothetical protein [Natrinema sp. 1APR25-10V2]MDS0474451.1 hypothetical protein [Natrinema sp. 1APR25-10V2]
MASLSLRDHVRPTTGDYPDGIYRVVGTGDESTTLLRVGDADGRRVATGEIVTLADDDLEAFEPADDPDGNRPLGATVVSTVKTGYWSLRAFGQQLAARPLPAAVAAALVLVGFAGEGALPVPEVVLTVSVLAGSLGLAFVGSGRL